MPFAKGLRHLRRWKDKLARQLAVHGSEMFGEIREVVKRRRGAKDAEAHPAVNVELLDAVVQHNAIKRHAQDKPAPLGPAPPDHKHAVAFVTDALLHVELGESRLEPRGVFRVHVNNRLAVVQDILARDPSQTRFDPGGRGPAGAGRAGRALADVALHLGSRRPLAFALALALALARSMHHGTPSFLKPPQRSLRRRKPARAPPGFHRFALPLPLPLPLPLGPLGPLALGSVPGLGVVYDPAGLVQPGGQGAEL